MSRSDMEHGLYQKGSAQLKLGAELDADGNLQAALSAYQRGLECMLLALHSEYELA